MRLIGQMCLLGALIGTGHAAVACVVGWRDGRQLIRRSGVLAAIASFLLLSLTLGILLHGLLSNDFRFAYVVDYSNRLLPWYYSFSALWVGQAGSLLLWAWLTALLALAFRYSPGRQPNTLREPAFGILMGFCCFLVGTMVFAADPMAPSLGTPHDGVGLSPLLQHPSMLVHPPIVFLGYSAWAIPFALAISALATGQGNAEWTSAARPWALFAWLVLGAGILLGAHWAYQELGWGGYWGWDPVENGSLIPWLLGTAAIHTMMAWRHRGMLKKSACVLTIATFGMCNFATFLTRSGIFSSLHAFSQSSIGWLFLGLMFVMAIVTGVLILKRRAWLASERPIPSLWCRESMIAANTLALVTLATLVTVGTLSSAISDAVIGRPIILGAAFYNRSLIPTGLLLLTATALAPLLRWGAAPTSSQMQMLWASLAAGGAVAGGSIFAGARSPVWLSVVGIVACGVAALAGSLWLDARTQPCASIRSEFLSMLRSRRRLYAGFVVHLGFFCLALGITASSLGTERRDVVLREGQTLTWTDHRIRLVKAVQRDLPGKLVAEAHLEVVRGNGSAKALTPAQHFHISQGEWTTEVSIDSTWSEDFYTILHGGEDDGGVRLTLVRNPLVRCIWAGGWVIGFGSIVALCPYPFARASVRAREASNQSHSKWSARGARAALWLAAATIAIGEQTICSQVV